MDGVPSPTKREPNRNPRRESSRLSSVTTAIHLLKTFTTEDQELGISELARRLKVAKSTVHRLANALLDEGFLQQSRETGLYRLGVGLFTLGSIVRARLDVTIEARPILKELREATQENVRLAVLEHASAVLLHDFEGPQTLRLRSGTGQLRPIHCSAEGLVLLSGLREPELTELLVAQREQRTPNTVVDEDDLRLVVRRIKRQGFAVEDETCDEGTRCVAAPVLNSECRVVAAIGVAGPRGRLNQAQLKTLSKLVVTAADQISERLGYVRGQQVYVPRKSVNVGD